MFKGIKFSFIALSTTVLFLSACGSSSGKNDSSDELRPPESQEDATLTVTVDYDSSSASGQILIEQTTVFNALGKPISQTGQSSFNEQEEFYVQTFDYNDNNLLLLQQKLVDSILTETTTFSYDSEGRVTSAEYNEINFSKVIYSYIYGESGKLLEATYQTDRPGSYIQRSHGENHPSLPLTDQDFSSFSLTKHGAKLINYVFDDELRVIEIHLDIESDGEVDRSVYYTYESGLLSLREFDLDLDSNADVWNVYSYDEHAQLVEQTFQQDGGEIEEFSSNYAYQNQFSTYWLMSYDESARLLERAEWFEDDPSDHFYQKANHSYDEQGNESIYSVTSDLSGLELELYKQYDAQNQLIQEDRYEYYGSPTPEHIRTLYTYNAQGLKQSINTDYDSNGVTDYSQNFTYNEQGHLLSWRIKDEDSDFGSSFVYEGDLSILDAVTFYYDVQ